MHRMNIDLRSLKHVVVLARVLSYIWLSSQFAAALEIRAGRLLSPRAFGTPLAVGRLIGQLKIDRLPLSSSFLFCVLCERSLSHASWFIDVQSRVLSQSTRSSQSRKDRVGIGMPQIPAPPEDVNKMSLADFRRAAALILRPSSAPSQHMRLSASKTFRFAQDT